jgi:DNA-binding response OmpR family regulator
MDGLTFVKELRKTHPALPVLFLSARTTAEDVVEGFETGGNDYLRKPFAMSELIIRIKSLIARSGGTIVKEFKIGKFTFNAERMTLNAIQLSTRESQVLAMLCAKMGNVVTSKDILMNLWGDDSFFNSRSLQVYITKLRKHLESDSSITLSNIRGVGYKLFVL